MKEMSPKKTRQKSVPPEALQALFEGILQIRPADLDIAGLVGSEFTACYGYIIDGTPSQATINLVYDELLILFELMSVTLGLKHEITNAQDITPEIATEFREWVTDIANDKLPVSIIVDKNVVPESERELRKITAVKVILLSRYAGMTVTDLSRGIGVAITSIPQVAHDGSGFLNDTILLKIASVLVREAARDKLLEFLSEQVPCSFNQLEAVAKRVQINRGRCERRLEARSRRKLEKSLRHLGFTGFDDFIASL